MKYRLYFRNLRAIDANLDRLSEALRVLEDISRFIVCNTQITEALKRMRHDLIPSDPALTNQLLAARDACDDVGRTSPVKGTNRKHLVDTVTANAKRSQQALRVLEEFSKLPQIPDQISQRDYEGARFTLYEIERELASALSRQEKLARIEGIYVIIDPNLLAGCSIYQTAKQVIAGGACTIQLRYKEPDKREFLQCAKTLHQICSESGVLFLINDNLDIATAVSADGIHLGQDDIPLEVAREMMSPDKIIGYTVRTVDQAVEALSTGADYLGVGSIYPSPTKPNAQVIGIEGLVQIRKAVSMPIVAIGGINANNALEVVQHGADGIAIISGILMSDDIISATRRLFEIYNRKGA